MAGRNIILVYGCVACEKLAGQLRKENRLQYVEGQAVCKYCRSKLSNFYIDLDTMNFDFTTRAERSLANKSR